MNDNQIEQEIQANGLTAPRVTPEDIEANIVDTEIVKHVSKSGQVLRWAVLTTRNGFAVVGKPSCAVSKENDNSEIGEKVAISNSKEELWPLMGYALRSELDAVTKEPRKCTCGPTEGCDRGPCSRD
ncbi:MAG TPA: Gp49 family protein [Noviherbaspirillum sp.]|nr:Gp49 family protein [Noviherbaspirillum sp.]